jgi:hypothetical protein
VLGIVGAFLQSLSPEQVEDLVAGRSRISLVGREAGRAPKIREKYSGVDYRRIREDLSNASSREVGEEYLEAQKLSRANLQAFARTLDIPVRKGDDMKAIREGIIEAIIGYRLRSGAIRGDGPGEDEAGGAGIPAFDPGSPLIETSTLTSPDGLEDRHAG